MNCIHGRPFGAFCPHCAAILGPRAPARVVVPPYTFRPFEALDSTVYPFVVTPEGAAAAVPTNVIPGLSWAPPPPVLKV